MQSAQWRVHSALLGVSVIASKIHPRSYVVKTSSPRLVIQACNQRTGMFTVHYRYAIRALASSQYTIDMQSAHWRVHSALLGVSVKLVARVNARCNLSRKKSQEVAASLPGRFLSRRCFTLSIINEIEPTTAKQYKCHQGT